MKTYHIAAHARLPAVAHFTIEAVSIEVAAEVAKGMLHATDPAVYFEVEDWAIENIQLLYVADDEGTEDMEVDLDLLG